MIIRIILFLLAFTFVILPFSCKKSSEKAGEKMIEKAIGKDADVDIDDEKMVIETEDGSYTVDGTVNTWPKEIPDYVPPFDEGEIINVSIIEMGEGKTWTVSYENVPENGLKEYRDELKSKGFKINALITMGAKGAHLTAEKDKTAVSVMSGEGNTVISVSIES